eukprot:765692-Hanusia_phi.AAC.6
MSETLKSSKRLSESLTHRMRKLESYQTLRLRVVPQLSTPGYFAAHTLGVVGVVRRSAVDPREGTTSEVPTCGARTC